MSINRSAALCLALVLTLVEFGSCLQCYHCNSQTDSKCAATFTSTIGPKDCSTKDSINYNQLNLYDVLPTEMFAGVQGAPRYCHKFVMGTGTVVRTCLEGSAADIQQTCKTMKEVTKNSSPDKKVTSCEVCNKDNCNGAGALSMSLPLSALTLIISYLLYKQ